MKSDETRKSHPAPRNTAQELVYELHRSIPNADAIVYFGVKFSFNV